MAKTLTTREKEAKRLRAKARRAEARRDVALTEVYKPLEEWDDEELARGRPRAYDGSFRGRGPSWISLAVHEEAVSRFKTQAQGDIRALVPAAIEQIRTILTDDSTDKRGRLHYPSSVKLQAATWTLEQLVGKSRQPIDMDISVRLQAILANVMVSPADSQQGEFRPAINPALLDVLDAEVVEDESED